MGIGFCMTHGRYSPDTANLGCPQCVALNQRLSQFAVQMPTASPERRTLNAGFRCKCRELFRLADCPDHIDRLQRDREWCMRELGDVLPLPYPEEQQPYRGMLYMRREDRVHHDWTPDLHDASAVGDPWPTAQERFGVSVPPAPIESLGRDA